MENKNNSFVVTVTPITDNSDLTMNTEKEIQAAEKKKNNALARNSSDFIHYCFFIVHFRM
ncbi:hypothetical protein [Bacillus sp. BC08]